MSGLGLLTQLTKPAHELPEPKLTYRVSQRDLRVLMRQLATLLRAGMQLLPALDALNDQLRGQKGPSEQGLCQVVEELRERVNEGTSLSKAMEVFPSLFSNPMIHMIRAGEEGGALDLTLIRLADMMERRAQLNQSIKSAITYPLIMGVVATGVIIYIMMYVIPGISQIFTQFERDLPVPTQVLITLCMTLKEKATLILGSIVMAILLAVLWIRSDEGRRRWDEIELKLPLWGRLRKKAELARVTQTFASLLQAGIPIHRALRISSGVIRNHVIQVAWDDITEAVQKGDSMSQAMEATGVFPPLLCHVVATGHQTNTVDEGVSYVSNLLEDEVEAATKSLSTLLEPLILLIMGGLIGFMVLAILLPIFEINQSL